MSEEAQLNCRRLALDVLIVCAMSSEAEVVKKTWGQALAVSRASSDAFPAGLAGGANPFRLEVGTFQGKRNLDVGILTSGIGLAAAASSLASALAVTSPQQVICCGSCGGLGREIKVKDVLAGDKYVFSRADATAFDYQVGQVPGWPAVFEGAGGLIEKARAKGAKVGGFASSDSFVTAANVTPVRQAFPGYVAAEMESAAYALVCYQHHLPFVAIRGVSDLCGPAAGQDFHVDAPVAVSAAAQIVGEVLGEL